MRSVPAVCNYMDKFFCCELARQVKVLLDPAENALRESCITLDLQDEIVRAAACQTNSPASYDVDDDDDGLCSDGGGCRVVVADLLDALAAKLKKRQEQASPQVPPARHHARAAVPRLTFSLRLVSQDSSHGEAQH